MIHGHGLPVRFPDAALAEAEQSVAPGLDGRADLRALALVTIDGADARDFDDAVWAEADSEPDNAGGWRAVVAIADVAHFVRPGSGGLFEGGIVPVRSFCTTFSHTGASAATWARSRASRLRPAVSSRWLWQVRQ